MYTHLAYTQTNTEFRKIFAEPRLGKIEDVNVLENEDDVEILMKFPIMDLGGKKKRKDPLKKSVAFGSTVVEDKVKKPVRKLPREETFDIPAEERILLSELKKKKCSIDKIEEILAAGADPNCQNHEGVRPIALGQL